MTKRQRQEIGTQKNKLLRYQLVLELYHQHKTEDNSVMCVWRKYIYPKYAVSRTTLYTILGTSVNKELKEIKAFEDSQLSMFG